MTIFRTRTLSVSIDCDPRKVYEFVADPANLPKWAKAFCLAVTKTTAGWEIATPDGPVGIRFCPPNDLGVLDHYVSPAPDTEISVPMRVLPNGTGSEIIFTLFQAPGMTDEKFLEDIRWVEQDLATLKTVLERA